MKKEMNNSCSIGTCTRCHGSVLLVIGVLLLVNAYWPFLADWTLVGWILAILGLAKIARPTCGHCE